MTNKKNCWTTWSEQRYQYWECNLQSIQYGYSTRAVKRGCHSNLSVNVSQPRKIRGYRGLNVYILLLVCNSLDHQCLVMMEPVCTVEITEITTWIIAWVTCFWSWCSWFVYSTFKVNIYYLTETRMSQDMNLNLFIFYKISLQILMRKYTF